jgi:uncharacterized membrane protein
MDTHAYLPGEQLLRQSAFLLALLAEAVAVAIIAVALVIATWHTLVAALRPSGPHPWSSVRLDLGRSLTLGLEFLLAADVVRTAVAPTWEDIGRLAAIAVIRTGLNYFLKLDIREVQAEESGDQRSTRQADSS